MCAESVETSLKHQLKQAAELRELAYRTVRSWRKAELSPASCFIGNAIFRRCLQTHQAIEILIRKKLPEDARALVRVLVEHTVNCAYMLTVADEQIARDFLEYPAYKKYQILQGLKASNESLVRQLVSPEQEEELRKEFEALRSRFKYRRNDVWCPDDQLHKRAARVDEIANQVENPNHASFSWLVNLEWRAASSYVHGTSHALWGWLRRDENGTVRGQHEFNLEDAVLTIFSANYCLYLVLPTVGLSLESENAEEVSVRLTKWKKLNAGAWWT